MYEKRKLVWSPVQTDRHGQFRTFTITDSVGEWEVRIIPKGDFVMGSPPTEAGRFADEGPCRKVTITESFGLMARPVDWALWHALTEEIAPSWLGPSPELHPVTARSYREVRKAITWLRSFEGGWCSRLPTEAEWEYACRAGTATATYAGDLTLEVHTDDNGHTLTGDYAPELKNIATYGYGYFDRENSRQLPFGLKDPNPWGLLDMLGGVWEFCAGRYSPYATLLDKVVDPYVPYISNSTVDTTNNRVARGGSFVDPARWCRAAARADYSANEAYPSLGFRLAFTMPELR